MVNGILLVDKEIGISSYDVIRRLKKVMEPGTKIGHAGTLDPFASGLLVILLGKCTKSNSRFQRMRKGYEVEAEFGYETDTNDPTGNITETVDNLLQIDKSRIEETIESSFTGELLQTPPVFSAKKVSGARAYDLARKGIDFKLETRKVKVYKFEIIGFDWPKVRFSIVCSSGTYVRKLIVDLARSLGVFATPVMLRRTYIGRHKVKDAVKSIDLETKPLSSSIIPCD